MYVFMKISKHRIPSFKTNLLSLKHDNDILLISYVPSLCFFALNSFYFMSDYFLLNKVSLNSLNSVAIFTPLAVLDSLPSSESKECIFDFNPTNLLIKIPLFTTFILPMTISF